MYNPNMRVSGILERSRSSSGNRYVNLANSASTAGKLKTIHVDKNQYPISVIQISEISEISWKKKAGFDLLSSSVASLSGGHSMYNLIMLVDNEVPMDT